VKGPTAKAIEDRKRNMAPVKGRKNCKTKIEENGNIGIRK